VYDKELQRVFDVHPWGCDGYATVVPSDGAEILAPARRAVGKDTVNEDAISKSATQDRSLGKAKKHALKQRERLTRDGYTPDRSTGEPWQLQAHNLSRGDRSF
jgi:hypothetical protein